MTPSVGYYVHHHGRGHLARAEAIVEHMTAKVTIFTSLDADVASASMVRLPPDDVPIRARDVPYPSTLHYSPVCCSGLTERMALMSQWAASHPAALMVVDVSAEVTTFARLCGLPVVAVRQHGRRDDSAHLLAYDCAVGLLAPFHPSLEEPSVGAAVRSKTMYSGGMSRYDGRAARSAGNNGDSRGRRRRVLVLGGAGGEGWDLGKVREAADRTEVWDWTVVGPARGSAGERVRHIGWLDDTFDMVSTADVVVASAGDATVNEVMSQRRPLVCIPEPRPFDEQVSKARRLHDLGAAISFERWPEAHLWPRILQDAMRLDCSAIHRTLNDGRGARRAAAHLEDLAVRFTELGRLDLEGMRTT